MTKIALVTGAGSGIGKACAQALLKEGWQVVFVGRRAEALQAAIAEAGDHGPRGLALPADLSDEAQVQALFQQVRERFGRLDLLFNNAGISLPTTLPGDLSGEDWRSAVGINLNGAFYCLSHAFKLMQTQSLREGASSTTARFPRKRRDRGRLPTPPPNTRSRA